MLSMFADMKGITFADRNRDARYAKTAQSVAMRPFRSDGSDLLGKTVGPSPGCPRHFATRGWGELVLDLKSCEGRGGEEPNHAPSVPQRSDGFELTRYPCGPGSERSRRFATRES
jgi:hypothetical protein